MTPDYVLGNNKYTCVKSLLASDS